MRSCVSDLTCWQFNNCGREPGGAGVGANGPCFAARHPECPCWLLVADPDLPHVCHRIEAGDSCLNCGYYHLRAVHHPDLDFDELLPTG